MFSFLLQVLRPQTRVKCLTLRTVERWVWSNHIWLLPGEPWDGKCLLLSACRWVHKPSKALTCLKEGKNPPLTPCSALSPVNSSERISSKDSAAPGALEAFILKSFKHAQISAQISAKPLLTSLCQLCSDPSCSDFTLYSCYCIILFFYFYSIINTSFPLFLPPYTLPCSFPNSYLFPLIAVTCTYVYVHTYIFLNITCSAYIMLQYSFRTIFH